MADADDRAARLRAERAERRLAVLDDIARSITASLDLDVVLERIAEGARQLCESDTAALFLREGDADVMVPRYRVGEFPPSYETLRITPGRGLGGRAWAARRPARTDRYLDDTGVGDAYHAIAREIGAVAVMAVPILLGDRVEGLLYLGRRSLRPFEADDETIGSRLALQAAIAIQNAQSFRREQTARAKAEAAERRTAFLAQASVLLSSSLDIEATLRSIARLAVPHLADFCAVDMLDERGAIRRLAVVHVDPEKEKAVRDLRERHGFRPEAEEGVPHVLRTGRSAFVPAVTDEHLRAAATSPEQLAALRALGLRSWMIVPLAARGRLLGALTFVMADSGRRYAEADVGMAEDLGRRAAIAIENAQLYREVQLASQTKDDFLATVSHELRTPINAVYGWARMLRQASLDPAASARALEVIERNARAQVQLIDDLLDVSRIVAGKMRLDVRPVEPAAAIEAALDAVRPAADAKGVALHAVLDPRAGPIMGDPDRLQQIVWNLCVNAVKFTPKGGRVQVTLRRVNSHVEIGVSDSGVGIPSEMLPRLFERFRQGQPGQGGLGIGLALVRHLVELHGGTVAARSEGPGHGAVFIVKLPLAIAAPVPGPTAPALPPLDAGGDTSLDGVHVLVVDDDADSRDLARTILELEGATVWTAASAGEALDQLTVRRPHVILSDVEMPMVDGYTFVRRLRALPREAGGTLPVVALTAYGGIQDRIRALEAGFDMHVPKPVDPSELRTVVARLARRGG